MSLRLQFFQGNNKLVDNEWLKIEAILMRYTVKNKLQQNPKHASLSVAFAEKLLALSILRFN